MCPDNKSKRFNFVALGLTGMVGIIILYILLTQQEQIKAFDWQFNGVFFIGLLIFHSLALGATFWAWHLMMARLGGFYDIRKSFRFYYVSTLAKRLPSGIPYVGSRLVMYRQQGVPTAAILNCLLLENLLFGLSGVLTFLSFSPFYTGIPKGITLPLSVIALLFVIAFIVRPQIIIDMTNWGLRKFSKQPIDSTPVRKDILIWLAIYTLPWIFASGSLYCAIHAFTSDITLQWFNAIAISTLSTLASLLNLLLPGGLALKELASSTLLTAWMPLSTALIITLSYRVIQTVNEILWALIALFSTFQVQEKHE